MLDLPHQKTQSLKDIQYKDGPQSMFDKVVELTGTVKIGGLTLRESLSKMFNSSKYKKSFIDGKRGTGSKGTRGALINEEINRYRKKAMSKIPEYLELLKQSDRSKKESKKKQYREQNPLNSTTTLKPDFSRFNEVFSE